MGRMKNADSLPTMGTLCTPGHTLSLLFPSTQRDNNRQGWAAPATSCVTKSFGNPCLTLVVVCENDRMSGLVFSFSRFVSENRGL